ncbi:hypothetical protein [Streptococcus sp. sy018]|uniref:hypothetical protein n=1 Tax=Streptococcus sp. sy018 TaxID=2600147 RepID=UPI0011B5D15F|nr:hypothetical protein [Streptococcus sp. sy018]TWS95554.1 hypothetical protein FRX52_01780 [Streptococcus sp. sy018]
MLEFQGPKLTVNLYCHAPMLHFQGKLSSNITLRASEVKPKLDQFIIKQVNEHKLKEYFLRNTKSLNYKLSFKLNKKNKEENEKSPMYYGKAENMKLVTTFPVMEIICFDKGLQALIIDYIEDFFIATNFGTVQGKGHGSFTIGKPSEDKIIKTLTSVYHVDTIYQLKNTDKALENIKNFYQLTKSGINNKNYQRSSLFYYMHKKGIDNEKAELKQKRIVKIYGTYRKTQYQTNKNPKFVRALLGLGAFIRFKSDVVLIKNKYNKYNKYNKQIERFNSPLFFKIISDNIYIIPRTDSIHLILKQSFIFKNKEKSITLKTPDEFDLHDFLSYAVKQYNQHCQRLFDKTHKIVPVHTQQKENYK